MLAGHAVYSPIVHSHPLVEYGLPTAWDFWKRIDREHLLRCDDVLVLMLDGWRESIGVAAEIRIAGELGKPLGYLASDGDGPTGYDALKEQARARNALLSLSGRDIGELPPVVNPERRSQAASSFRSFCETYFPQTFHLAWSPDHLKVIEKIEQAVLQGGLFALAMPRGSGKTTIAECACLWSILFGHREFVALIEASEIHAEEMLDSMKRELDGNDLLLDDFPEAVYPIHRLEGISNRCAGQLHQGERTHIAWTAKEIVLPTIAGSKASGAIIKVAGITGRIRGMKLKRANGRSVRPSLVILDDPRVGTLAVAVRPAGKHSGGSRAGDGGAGSQDLRSDALHGHSSRRHGRPDPEPRQAPAVAGGRARR